MTMTTTTPAITFHDQAPFFQAPEGMKVTDVTITLERYNLLIEANERMLQTLRKLQTVGVLEHERQIAVTVGLAARPRLSDMQVAVIK